MPRTCPWIKGKISSFLWECGFFDERWWEVRPRGHGGRRVSLASRPKEQDQPWLLVRNTTEQASCVHGDYIHAKTREIVHRALWKLYRAHQFDWRHRRAIVWSTIVWSHCRGEKGGRNLSLLLLFICWYTNSLKETLTKKTKRKLGKILMFFKIYILFKVKTDLGGKQ